MPETIQIGLAWAIVIATLTGAVTIVSLVRARIRRAAPPVGADPEEVANLQDAVQR